MTHYSSIIKGLEASRRLGSEINLDNHKQDLERTKLEKELQHLSSSRRQFVQSQISKSKKEYEYKLREDEKIREQHEGRQKRSEAERAKVAQADFQRNRKRLVDERNEHDEMDRKSRVIEKKILDLKANSRFASEDEDRLIRELNNRKQVVIKLLEQSRKRQLYHYGQSKNLSSF